LMIGVRGGGRDAKGVKEWRRGREWGRKGGGVPVGRRVVGVLERRGIRYGCDTMGREVRAKTGEKR